MGLKSKKQRRKKIHKGALSGYDVRDFVKANCQQKLRRIHLERHFNRDKVSINKALRRDIGLNFRQLLLQCRMNVARFALRRYKNDIAFIAEYCGHSPAHRAYDFSRAFKKYHGITPMQYRAMAWGGRKLFRLRGEKGLTNNIGVPKVGIQGPRGRWAWSKEQAQAKYEEISRTHNPRLLRKQQLIGRKPPQK